jgi:cell division protein FtsW (lipid II flippase)
VRYVWPLLCVVLVLIGVQLITRDMGPLLIACYGAGAFVAASIAMWWHQRSGAYRAAFALAMALFVTWILGTTLALFELGALDDVTAGRLENLAAPLASANDQLALVTWFQQAAPPAGFGLGAVPWCGHASSAGCSGVPAQIQSDYSLTALVGVFGWTTAWAVTIGCAIWLHRLIRHHGRVTRGEPRLVAAFGRVANDDQALLSWFAVTWVVLALCQLAVTVAGNLAVLPLTGVTFPFVSFGMTSLLVNMALLGLAINVNLPARTAHG